MQPAELYARVREKEGRLYPDALASNLPDVPGAHPLAKEWRARAESAGRLTEYLKRLRPPLHVLEAGCGNGWLAHQMAGVADARVVGLDRPGPDLAQAGRLFMAANLSFVQADVLLPPFQPGTFRAVVLASAIQYIQDLVSLIRRLQPLMTDGGEIHVLDSPIYDKRELESARRRTKEYYAALGCPEMAEYYFHHTTQELQSFFPEYLYAPQAWSSRFSRVLGGATSPFPWIRILGSKIPPPGANDALPAC